MLFRVFLILILTENSTKGDEFWWRDCKPRHEEPLLCLEHKTQYHDRPIIYDECLCDTNGCNQHMQPIVTPSPGMTISTIRLCLTKL